MFRIVRLFLLLLIIAVSAACASDVEGDQPTSTVSEQTNLDDDSRLSTCGGADHPCKWADVDQSVHEREAELASGVAEILEAEDLRQAYEWVRNQDDVVEAFLEETMVVFRLAGGMPNVTVEPLVSESVEPTAANAQLVSYGIEAPPRRVVGVGTDREHPQNHKRALILQPYQWQGLTMDPYAGEESVAILRAIPDYAHAPDAVEVAYDDDVTPFTFQNWDAFDVIFVESHGGRWGAGTWIATGVKVELEKGKYWEQCLELMAPYVDLTGVKCGQLTDKATKITYLNLGITLSFWEEEYASRGGLDETVIYMGGCLTLVREEASPGRPDLPKLLAGNSSAYVGWTGTVFFDKEGNVASALLYVLASQERSRTVKAALDTLCENDLCGGEGFSPSGNTQLGIYKHGGDPGSLRIYDVPTLVDPKTATSSLGLQEGAKLRIIGTPGDDVDDQLVIAVDMRGIIDPNDISGGIEGSDNVARGGLMTIALEDNPAKMYDLSFFINGEDIGIDNLGDPRNPSSSATEIGVNRYLYTYTADLGFDVDPEGTEATLNVEVSLPEGGISNYEVDVELVGANTGATISVGDTWEFELITSYGGCLVDDNGVLTAGFVDGDFLGISFSALLLRSGAGEITISSSNGEWEWMAAADRQNMTVLHLVPEGDSQIDTISFDDNTISGTATFINTVAFREAWSNNVPYPGSVPGSFEIVCPGPVVTD